MPSRVTRRIATGSSEGGSGVGSATVGADTLIGLGASVRPGVKIGAGCIIGVGAAVVRDVKDGEKVIGVPARPVEWWTEGDSG